MKKIVIINYIILSTILFISGCGPSDVKNQITVASKIDTEGALLGKMIVIVLKNNNLNVIDKTSFGTTEIMRKAIISKEIDIYPEYTGNGGFFFSSADPALWKDRLKGYQTVKKLDYDKNRIAWLTPAKANNTWAIAVRRDIAEKEKLVTLEDMASYINRGGKIKLACSEEFISRPDALPAFQKAYGFKLNKKQLLSLSGGNTAMTEKAAASGTDGVNFAMAYGSDGSLFALGLIVLSDSKGVQPVYEPAPIVREEILLKYPEIETLLKPVFESLDLVILQSLNAKISVNGENAETVAAEYLKSKGFIK